MMPLKRRFDTDTNQVSKLDDELLILQPACRLQDLKIQGIVEDVLKGNLRGVFYNAWDSEARSSFLREIIKQELSKIQLNASNVAVLVMIGEVNDTTIEKASHRVWKPDYDSFASAWYKNESLFAIGTVFLNYDKPVRKIM
ncbi:tctex1 domain-containing protein 1-A [Exaiptasia diaphana]|uniref:Uncharacterized protein n=1 Tax=Exaiptasia diaphana TaxID=2652724 RepID=A0A913YCY4_EXADI|nr:tctex1 domain-containing protein 1-A [Exaiptasia diaphana]KXJ19283.1 Tctex1 domain-containing protein 1-A [Exaiptasia diaphana]